MRFHIGFSKRIHLKTLIKILIGLLALFGIYFSSTSMVFAEDFNNPNAFHYWTYYNSDSMREEGTGLINNHTWNQPINRVQWLYSAYQYYTGYMYDISFTYYASSIPIGDNGILDFVDSCSIGTGGNSYQCFVNKGTSNGEDYVQISIANFVGNNQNNLWINFYSNTNKMVYLNPTRYILKINAKQDTGATSEDIYNATNNIITNNNNNTNTIINNNNQNTQNITDSIDDLNDSINESYDGSAGGHQFLLPETNYPSTIQALFNLPIDLLRTIVNNADSCTPYDIDFSSITQRWGGFDYTLRLPCLRSKLQSLLGYIYNLCDYLLAFFIFYNIAMYILQLIDAITSGTDLFSYLYHGTNNNSGGSGYGHYNRDTGEVID